jgi:hypothetical protein
MIDRKRAASIFGVSVLILSLVSFGVPVPVVQDGTPDKSESVDAIHPSYEIQMTTTDGYMTQDARALACGGFCVAGVVALTAGTAGTVIGAKYFSASPSDQSSAYYAAENLKDRIQADYSTLNSSYEATRTMAYRVAETSFAEEMANGSSKSQAQAYADQEVEDYLSGVVNDEIVRRNNAYTTTIQRIQNNSGVHMGFGSPSDTMATRNVTLPNDNETEVVLLDGPDDRTFYYVGVAKAPDNNNYTVLFDSSDYDDVTLPIPDPYIYDRYVGIETEVDNEIANFTDSVSEAKYENLSADEIVSPVNQALEWGESYNETGSSGYASALASSLGYAVDETGTVYSVKMPHDSSTWYNGTVYADESTIPNGTITTGKVYNGSDTTAYVATSSGTTTLDKDWKVVEIETRDGESLNATALSTWSRDSLNASAPLTTLEKWKELKEEAESGGIGGGLFSGGGFLPLVPWDSALIDVLVLLGAGYLLVGGRRGGGTVVSG